MSPIQALRKSLELTRGFGVELFVLGVAFLGLNILGVLCLGVGLLVTMPVTGLATAFVFRHLQGRPDASVRSAAGRAPTI